MMNKFILAVFLLYLSGCDGSPKIKNGIKTEIYKGTSLAVDGDIWIGNEVHVVQKYVSFPEVYDKTLDADFYFVNQTTGEKIHPHQLMYVKTTKGLVRMPNLKPLSFRNFPKAYNGKLYFIFGVEQSSLLTDCQAKTWSKETSVTYIAEWHKEQGKFIIDHTALFNPKDYHDLFENSRATGQEADMDLFLVQHAIAFDCTQPYNDNKPLDYIQSTEL